MENLPSRLLNALPRLILYHDFLTPFPFLCAILVNVKHVLHGRPLKYLTQKGNPFCLIECKTSEESLR